MKRALTFGVAGIAALLLTASHAEADDLGTANDYNVFVLGNNTQYGTDAGGRVAVGGNADFTNGGSNGYTLHGTGTSIVVGGSYKNRYNSVDGNVYVNGAANIEGPSISGSVYGNSAVNFTGGGSMTGSINIVSGQTYTHAQSYAPFTTPNVSATAYKVPTNPATVTVTGSTATMDIAGYFASASSYLTGHSTGWGALAANGTTSISSNIITLNSGSGGASGVDIFTVTGAQLNSSTGLVINARSGNTVLVNFTGTSDLFPNYQITINNTDKTKVLYNFYQATALTLNGLSVQGSLLAPLASINFNSGNIDGTLIAKDLYGTGESHSFTFTGNLPTINSSVAATPEPGSVAIFGAVLISGAGLLRRRRK